MNFVGCYFVLHDDFEVSQYSTFPKPLYHNYLRDVDVDLKNR